MHIVKTDNATVPPQVWNGTSYRPQKQQGQGHRAVRLLNMSVTALIENEWVIAKIFYASNRHRGSLVVFGKSILFRNRLLMTVCSINKIYRESQILENSGSSPTETMRLLQIIR